MNSPLAERSRHSQKMPHSVLSLSDLSYEALLVGLGSGYPCLETTDVDEQFFTEMLHTASKRRLLTDKFLNALCSSGTPPPSLSLERREVDVRHVLKPPRNPHYQHSSSLPSSTFSSSSEMLYTCLASLTLSNFGSYTYNDDDISTVLSHISRLSLSLSEISLNKVRSTNPISTSLPQN